MATSSQQPRGSPLIQYDPHNFDVYAVNEYGKIFYFIVKNFLADQCRPEHK